MTPSVQELGGTQERGTGLGCNEASQGSAVGTWFAQTRTCSPWLGHLEQIPAEGMNPWPSPTLQSLPSPSTTSPGAALAP